MLSPIAVREVPTTATLVGHLDGDALADVLAVVPPDLYLLRGTRSALGSGLEPPAPFSNAAAGGFNVSCASFTLGSLDGEADSIAAIWRYPLAGEGPCSDDPGTGTTTLLRPPGYLVSPIKDTSAYWRGRFYLLDLNGDRRAELLGRQD